MHILAAAQIHICSLYLSTLNKVAVEERRSITGEWRVGGLNFEIDDEIQNIQRRADLGADHLLHLDLGWSYSPVHEVP